MKKNKIKNKDDKQRQISPPSKNIFAEQFEVKKDDRKDTVQKVAIPVSATRDSKPDMDGNKNNDVALALGIVPYHDNDEQNIKLDSATPEISDAKTQPKKRDTEQIISEIKEIKKKLELLRLELMEAL